VSSLFSPGDAKNSRRVPLLALLAAGAAAPAGLTLFAAEPSESFPTVVSHMKAAKPEIEKRERVWPLRRRDVCEEKGRHLRSPPSGARVPRETGTLTASLRGLSSTHVRKGIGRCASLSNGYM